MAQPFLPQQPAAEQEAAPVAAQPKFVESSVVGNRDDDIRRQEAIDPTENEEVTGDEQAQYDDFVSRCIALISDSRKPDDGGMSPSEASVNVMSNSTMSVPQALAEGAASTIMIIHDAAKRAGKAYSADVIFHGADEVIAGLYMLGSAAGIFTGASEYSTSGGVQATAQPMQSTAQAGAAQAGGAAALPPQQPTAMAGGAAALPPEAPTAMPQQGMESDVVDGDFTDEEYLMMGEAKILATEIFGRRLLETGQLDESARQEAQAFWDSQIMKEVESGQADEGMLFDQMDIATIQSKIMGK